MDKNKKLFPQRLWELIHDEKYNFCLRWSPDGQRVYLNRNEFEANYLKTPNNQFHTQKAISFVRQMNMYGFRKVDDCFYENDNFKRNCPQLLKNMVRRHSNKGFSTVLTDQNNHLHHNEQMSPEHDPTIICQEQMSPNSSASATAAAVVAVAAAASARAAAAANIDAERQSAQCYRETTTNSVGNIQAAMAAINSGSVQTPLAASTLYHRLAAINFGQHEANEQASFVRQNLNHVNSIVGHQDSILPSIDEIETVSSTPRVVLDQQQQAQSQPQQPQQQQPINSNDIPMSPQQSLLARQALQETIVRSLLQLKQPQIPLSLQQNLLATIQQQSPNLLLQSLTSFTAAANCALHQVDQRSSPLPLELVVSQASTNAENVSNWCARSFGMGVNSSSFINSIESSRNQINNDDNDNNDDDDEDEEFFEDGEYSPNVNKYEPLSRNTNSLGASSSSSREMTNHSLNSENIILDLVKPSTNGKKKN